MNNFIAVMVIPLLLLNSFAGIVSAIWLFVLGFWQIPVYGFVIVMLFPFAHMLVTLPLSLVFGGTAYLLSKGGWNKLSKTAAISMSVVLDVVHFSWAVIVFTILITMADTLGIPLFPILLAAYAISVGGINGMAAEERGNEFTMLSTFSAQLVSVSISVFFILGLQILTIPLMLLVIVVHAIIVNRILKAAAEYEDLELITRQDEFGSVERETGSDY